MPEAGVPGASPAPGSTPSPAPGSIARDGVPPPSSETTRVAIVDDQAMVRQGFGALLDAQPDMSVVGSAEDGSQVVDLVRRTAPDVILMDIRMPKLNGLDATRAVFSMPGEHPKIIMLTTFDA
ncbi:MAG: response regulator transcription factor, partial [Brevibacterium sp.]|nr:response regulator transcription factor [Brevibacterium sp.]